MEAAEVAACVNFELNYYLVKAQELVKHSRCRVANGSAPLVHRTGIRAGPRAVFGAPSLPVFLAAARSCCCSLGVKSRRAAGFFDRSAFCSAASRASRREGDRDVPRPLEMATDRAVASREGDGDAPASARSIMVCMLCKNRM